MAIHDGLQIDLAHAFQVANEEGINRHQIAGMPCFYMSLTEFRTEAFQQTNLFVAQVDLSLTNMFLQSKQPLWPGQQIVTAPDTAHTARGDMDAFQGQFLCYPQGTMRGMIQAMLQNCFFDLLRYPVWVGSPCAGQAVNQASSVYVHQEAFYQQDYEFPLTHFHTLCLDQVSRSVLPHWNKAVPAGVTRPR